MNQEENLRELMLLRKELETTTQIKNNRIIELEHTVRALQSRLSQSQSKEKIHTQQISQLRNKVREMQAFSRQRSQVATQRSLTISKLQQELQSVKKLNAEQLENQVKVLQKVVQAQNQQMTVYIQDHEAYLQYLEQIKHPWQYMQAQRTLLAEYTHQLNIQILATQNTCDQLQYWVRQSHEELHLQNEQANDLLGQLQYVVEPPLQ